MGARQLLLVVIALLVSGCDRSSDTPSDHSEVVTTIMVTDPYPDAVEVRLFVQNDWSEEDGKPVFNNPDGISLNENQRTKFEESLMIERLPDELAACFVPHHFFRYFDAVGTKIGEVAVCFCCEGVQASGSEQLVAPDGMWVSANYSKLKSLVTNLGEPTDILCRVPE